MGKVIQFHKMSGSGNDFIIIDNRNKVMNRIPLKKFIQKVCRRGLSVGADGLILIEKSTRANFKWRYYNANGEEASMCGNGARCVARYAVLKKIASPELTFEIQNKVIPAHVKKNKVWIQMIENQKIEFNISLSIDQKEWNGHFMVMGVPHWVHFSKNIDQIDVSGIGRKIRHHPYFHPEGTNVNFVNILNEREMKIRTYERGVEAETLACGTGAVASALIAHHIHKVSSPVTVYPKGDIPLTVYFKLHQGEFSDVYLEGDARIIFEGFLSQEAWLN